MYRVSFQNPGGELDSRTAPTPAAAAMPAYDKLGLAMTQADYDTAIHQRTYDRLVASQGAEAANKWLKAMGRPAAKVRRAC